MIRLALMTAMVSFIAGCYSGMKVDVAPPECTVDENSPECYTRPEEPMPMENEKFFQEELSDIHWMSFVA